MNSFKQSLDIKIYFFLRGTYQNDEKQNPIVLRITYRQERRDLFTGLYCAKKLWNSSENRMAGLGKEATITNQHLERIQYNVREHFDKLRFSDEVFTIDDLVLMVKGKEAPPQTLMEYATLRIEEYKERVGVDISITTYYKYKRTANYLSDYMRDKHAVTNIAVASVNEAFLSHFFKYLRTDKANSHNSALALMNCLRTILKMAIRNGVIKINPYDTFRVGFKPVDRDFLDKEEIEKLANLEIDDQRLALYRDFFLFACYTGLAYSDIQQFKREHIKLDTDGTYYIKKPRQKTGGVSIIPLLDPAIRILIKYSLTGDPRDFIWHVVCNQVLNRHLKKIARMAKIDKQLFMHLARHTFATTVTLSNGVPLETVSKMLGHTSLKHTVRYARVVAEKIKNDMGRVRGVFK